MCKHEYTLYVTGSEYVQLAHTLRNDAAAAPNLAKDLIITSANFYANKVNHSRIYRGFGALWQHPCHLKFLRYHLYP